MGKKVNPIGFRLGYNIDWNEKNFDIYKSKQKYNLLLQKEIIFRTIVKQKGYPLFIKSEANKILVYIYFPKKSLKKKKKNNFYLKKLKYLWFIKAFKSYNNFLYFYNLKRISYLNKNLKKLNLDHRRKYYKDYIFKQKKKRSWWKKKIIKSIPQKKLKIFFTLNSKKFRSLGFVFYFPSKKINKKNYYFKNKFLLLKKNNQYYNIKLKNFNEIIKYKKNKNKFLTNLFFTKNLNLINLNFKYKFKDIIQYLQNQLRIRKIFYKKQYFKERKNILKIKYEKTYGYSRFYMKMHMFLTRTRLFWRDRRFFKKRFRFGIIMQRFIKRSLERRGRYLKILNNKFLIKNINYIIKKDNSYNLRKFFLKKGKNRKEIYALKDFIWQRLWQHKRFNKKKVSVPVRLKLKRIRSLLDKWLVKGFVYYPRRRPFYKKKSNFFYSKKKKFLGLKKTKRFFRIADASEKKRLGLLEFYKRRLPRLRKRKRKWFFNWRDRKLNRREYNIDSGKTYFFINNKKINRKYNNLVVKNIFSNNVKLILLKNKLEKKLLKFNLGKNVALINLGHSLKDFGIPLIEKKIVKKLFFIRIRGLKDLLNIITISILYKNINFLNYYISTIIKGYRNQYQIVLSLTSIFRVLFKVTGLFKVLKFQLKGRLNNSDRTKIYKSVIGNKGIKANSISEEILYSFSHVFSLYGTFGFRIWLLK